MRVSCLKSPGENVRAKLNPHSVIVLLLGPRRRRSKQSAEQAARRIAEQSALLRRRRAPVRALVAERQRLVALEIEFVGAIEPIERAAVAPACLFEQEVARQHATRVPHEGAEQVELR